MHQLSSYLARTISASIVLVLVVIIGIDVIAAVIDELGEMRANYDFIAVLKYVALSIPGSIYDYLPFSCLVGCLAGLGLLASNSELVVIRSAGISTARIVWMVVRPALVIALVGLLISEYVAPNTENIAQSERAKAMRSERSVLGDQGLWHREGENFMHFDVVEPNGVLHGVMIYEFDAARRLQKTIYAERAIYQQQTWVLEDVNESVVEPRLIQQTRLSSRPWHTDLSPDLLNILVLEPDDLSMVALWRYAAYLRSQGLNGGFYQLAFWKKVLQPVSTLTLVLIAASFIFGPLREVTMGFRIFTGVIVGIVFRTTQDMLSPASMVYGFPPIYASLAPIIIGMAVGFVLLKRVR